MRESRTSGISVRGGGSNPPVYSTGENFVVSSSIIAKMMVQIAEHRHKKSDSE
jgi:hypothetical protein